MGGKSEKKSILRNGFFYGFSAFLQKPLFTETKGEDVLCLEIKNQT